MNPRKIFLFGLCVTVIILAASFFFPGGVTLGTISFLYPDYRTWLKPDTTAYKDIRLIIAMVDTVDFPFEPLQFPLNDTISTDSIDSIAKEEIIIKRDTLKRKSIDMAFADIQSFEFSQGQDTLLFPLFRSFHNMHGRNKPVRVLHYGDSQIEADRITSTIRNFMQRKYGGRGVGFLPVVPVADVAITFQQDVSPRWKRFSALDKGNRAQVERGRFGIAGNLVRYDPVDQTDTVAHIGLLPVYTGYRNSRTFTHARLFYGTAEKPFPIIVNRKDTVIMTAHDTVSSALWHFDASQNSLDLQLISSCLPDLYGIALDGENGVAVDNLPLRGSLGLDFFRMDTAQMGQMFRMIDVEMLILQFGANVVTNMVKNFDDYARRFVNELRMLQALKPGLTIAVIGVHDMSRNTQDGYQSYPNIVQIRDAQKKAAFETGCVFWDLYEAMGGNNSMPGWVFADPPLAKKDFVHFTIGGAKIVAELFCKAWEKEYQIFLSNQ